MPVHVQASVLSRVWSFDRAHAARAEDDLVIGIVYQGRNRASLLARDAFELALSEQLPEGPRGRARVVALEIESPEGLARSLAEERVDILYLTPLRAVDVHRLAEATRQMGILSCTGVPDYVAQGISVGIGLQEGRPEILVNLEGARAEGADFRSQLLKVAHLVGGAP